MDQHWIAPLVYPDMILHRTILSWRTHSEERSKDVYRNKWLSEWIHSWQVCMYVCIYVFMYVHVCDVVTCLLIPSVWRFCLSVPMFVRMCVNKKVCMYVCTVCMYVCMYVCMHTCKYACMHVCMYFVYMSLPQMRLCDIAPHHPLGIYHNNVAADNTFPTCFRGRSGWDTK